MKLINFNIKSEDNNYLAFITFQDYGENIIAIDHTFVDPSLRGQKNSLTISRRGCEIRSR